MPVSSSQDHGLEIAHHAVNSARRRESNSGHPTTGPPSATFSTAATTPFSSSTVPIPTPSSTTAPSLSQSLSLGRTSISRMFSTGSSVGSLFTSASFGGRKSSSGDSSILAFDKPEINTSQIPAGAQTLRHPLHPPKADHHYYDKIFHMDEF